MTATARQFDAVLFDHDGTLIDSLPAVVAATNTALRDYGYAEEPPAAVIEAMVYPTTPRMGRHARVSDPGEQQRLAMAFYRSLQRLAPTMTKPYPGVADMLLHLAQAGVRMGMLSNNQGAIVRAIMRHHNFDNYMDVIYGEEDVPAPKPDPVGVRLAMQCIGVAPERCLFVGDSINDSDVAQAAGIASVGVTWGVHDHCELHRCGFTAVVHNVDELERYMLG